MIRYTLTCAKSHEFEAWFPSSAAYETQVKRKLVTCPVCGSAKVEKALMAPRVVTSDKAAARPAKEDAASPAAPPAAVPAQFAANEQQRAMLRQLKALREKVLANSDYVGPRFAEEARRMHHNEAPQRGIHGEARLEDVKALAEDGIDVLPLPVLPDDQN